MFLKSYSDERGTLTVAGPPFDVKRVFWIYGCNPGIVRGNHANKTQSEYAVCVSGICYLSLRKADLIQHFHMNTPDNGVLIPPMTWLQYIFAEPGTVLLVMSSHPYDKDDHISDYTQYLTALR